MNAPKISVIIPLYNAEKFIRQCLISVLSSKFQGYEVLVVDDCSTDGSVAEVNKLLPHFDGRLKIFSTEKNSGGAGVPRNVGIKNATGKYLTFVDNDDMLLPTALENFFDAAEEFRADVVHTTKSFVFRGDDFKRENLQLQSDDSDDFYGTPRLEPEELATRMKDYVDGKFFWLPWGKLFRRNFLLDNRIDFPRMQFSEDMVFCFKCLCLAKNYLRVPFVANIHEIRSDSASKKSMSSSEGVVRWLNVVTAGSKSLDDFMGEREFFRANPATRRAVLKFFVDKHFGMIKNLFQGLEPHEVQEIFFDELQNPALPAVGKNLVAAYLLAERALKKF